VLSNIAAAVPGPLAICSIFTAKQLSNFNEKVAALVLVVVLTKTRRTRQ